MVRIREIACVASSECPPSSKKPSCAPTRSGASLSTSAKAPAMASSTGPRGATYARATSAPASGAGSARRSILPLAVSGSAGSSTNADGTRCSGSAAPTKARSSVGEGAAAEVDPASLATT